MNDLSFILLVAIFAVVGCAALVGLVWWLDDRKAARGLRAALDAELRAAWHKRND